MIGPWRDGRCPVLVQKMGRHRGRPSIKIFDMASSSMWPRFQKYFLRYADLGFSLDISRMRFADDFFDAMQPRVEKAFAAMRELEAGAIANPDEQRMVGHYWLRNPELAPNDELRATSWRRMRESKVLPPTCTWVASRRLTDGHSNTFCSSASAARRSDRNSSRRRSVRRAIRWILFFRQHRSRWIRSRSRQDR